MNDKRNDFVTIENLLEVVTPEKIIVTSNLSTHNQQDIVSIKRIQISILLYLVIIVMTSSKLEIQR